MASTLRDLILAAGILAAIPGNSQCPSVVDISMVPNQNDQLEVWLRPQAFFDGHFSSIVFTVRWPQADGASLGSLTQDMAPYFSTGTSGPEHTDQGFKYQIYAGFGALSPLYDFGESWNAGEEVLLSRINILNGNSYFQIVDDSWTEANNGGWYISMNGFDCVGEIYNFTTSITPSTATSGISISPNPTSGLATVVVDMEERTDIFFELMDASGRKVWDSFLPDRGGRHEEHLDLNGLSDGIYLLNVRMGGTSSVHRIVLGSGTY